MKPLPLPLKPAFDPARPNVYYVRAAKFFNAGRRLGYAIPAVVGMMVAQPDMEASFRSDVVGDHGTAFNACQWHEPRVSQILAGCGVNVTTETDIGRLVAAIDWELRSPQFAQALAAITSATTAAEAAEAACAYYERAGADDAAFRRGEDAEWWTVFFARNMAWAEAQG